MVRGRHEPQVTMLAFIDLETRMPPDHPLRVIKKLADQALKALSPDLDRMYADVGRPSIPPERLLKSSLLIALYSVRSERGFCEQLDYNLLFRWFLGMNLVEPSFDATTFTKNRERLLKHRVGQALFDEVVLEADRWGLLSDEHFTVDGTLIEAAQVPSCRRRFILEYFGEQWPEENCGGCDVCLESREEFDATEIAQKIPSAVVRTGERFGANHIIQVLSGSREKRILELGHDRLSVYGIAKDVGRPELREIIGQLQARRLLVRSEGEYPTLAVTDGGRQLLQGRIRHRSSLRTSAPRSL